MIRRVSRLFGLRALMLWLAKRERTRALELRMAMERVRMAAEHRAAMWDAYIHAPTHREAARIMTRLMVLELR